MVRDNDIIKYFLQTSKGVRGTARHFGLSYSHVGAIINNYKKQNCIR